MRASYSRGTVVTVKTVFLTQTKHQSVVSYHSVVECKNADVSAVVDVIPSDDWVAMVFNPDPSQSVV